MSEEQIRTVGVPESLYPTFRSIKKLIQFCEDKDIPKWSIKSHLSEGGTQIFTCSITGNDNSSCASSDMITQAIGTAICTYNKKKSLPQSVVTKRLPILERKSTYPADKILGMVCARPANDDLVIPHYVKVDGDLINLAKRKMQLFKHKGITCARCGVKGVYFAKERLMHQRCEHIKRYNLNLYAIDEEGQEVLMTIDHIIPKSRGGPDTLDNYQPMCLVCNHRKRNKI